MVVSDTVQAPIVKLVDVADIEWREVELAASSPAVKLKRLHGDTDTGAFTVMVRFPPGWARDGDGHYDVIEEVLFLAGSLHLTGETYEADDYTVLPSDYPRHGSRAGDNGAFALAWFSGANDWHPGASTEEDRARADWSRHRWTDVEPTVDSPLGSGRARVLRVGGDRSAFVLDGVDAGAPSPATAELYSFDDRVWARVPAGAPLPVLVGPLYCRIQHL